MSSEIFLPTLSEYLSIIHLIPKKVRLLLKLSALVAYFLKHLQICHLNQVICSRFNSKTIMNGVSTCTYCWYSCRFKQRDFRFSGSLQWLSNVSDMALYITFTKWDSPVPQLPERIMCTDSTSCLSYLHNL